MSNTISILIKAQDNASKSIKNIGDNIESAGNKSEQSSGNFEKFNGKLLALAGVAAGASIATHKLFGVMDQSIDSANRYQAAIAGLSSVAEAFGTDAGKAEKAARELASDGLMSVTDAATGLKNLLASGFNLEEANTLMLRFKDSAAFGRQSSLEFGQAIASATEGIKNGNSILVDNAGVTKNLSMMLTDAGYSAQDLMRASDDAGVRQAIFNGILKETNAQAGDAAKLVNSAAGEQAKWTAATEALRIKLGIALQPALLQILDTITPMVVAFADWVGNNSELAAGILITATAVTGLVASVAGLTAVVNLVKLATGAWMVAQTLLNVVLAANPVLLLAGALVGLIGVLGMVVFNTDNTKGATDRLREAQDWLKQSTDDLKGAQKSLADAELSKEEATLRVERAQLNYNDAVRRYGPASLEAREAGLQLQRAHENVKTATDNVKTATDDLRKKTDLSKIAQANHAVETERNKIELENLKKGLDNLNGKVFGYTLEEKRRIIGDSVSSPQAKMEAYLAPTTFGRAQGTSYAPGGWTWVGERGPELVRLPTGSQVMQNYRSQQVASEGGGGDTHITISGTINIATPEAAESFWNRIDQTQRLAKVGMA